MNRRIPVRFVNVRRLAHVQLRMIVFWRMGVEPCEGTINNPRPQFSPRFRPDDDGVNIGTWNHSRLQCPGFLESRSFSYFPPIRYIEIVTVRIICYIMPIKNADFLPAISTESITHRNISILSRLRKYNSNHMVAYRGVFRQAHTHTRRKRRV